jgi:hypothetical protein
MSRTTWKRRGEKTRRDERRQGWKGGEGRRAREKEGEGEESGEGGEDDGRVQVDVCVLSFATKVGEGGGQGNNGTLLYGGRPHLNHRHWETCFYWNNNHPPTGLSFELTR